MAGAERLLDVMMMVATASGPSGAREVAEAAKIPLSTAYRNLAQLKERGFVEDLGRDIGFGPGPLLWRIALSFDRRTQVLPLADAPMRALSEATQESVALMKAVGSQVVCMDMLDSPLPLRCSFGRGRSQPLVRGASAKALLAHLPEFAADQITRQFVPDTRERIRFQDTLAQIRKQGYAESSSEVDEGIWGVSAPVFSAPGQLECGLSLMAPLARGEARRDEFIARTVAAAAEISAGLQQFTKTSNGG